MPGSFHELLCYWHMHYSANIKNKFDYKAFDTKSFSIAFPALTRMYTKIAVQLLARQ